MEQNPSKGWGVFEIPRKLSFWGGEGEGKGLGQKKIVLSLVDQMVTAFRFEVNQPKKADTQIHTHTDRHSIAFRDRIFIYLVQLLAQISSGLSRINDL